MDEVPQSTRLTLLIRLRDGRDKEAWSDFVELYSPVVYGFARRHNAIARSHCAAAPS